MTRSELKQLIKETIAENANAIDINAPINPELKQKMAEMLKDAYNVLSKSRTMEDFGSVSGLEMDDVTGRIILTLANGRGARGGTGKHYMGEK